MLERRHPGAVDGELGDVVEDHDDPAGPRVGAAAPEPSPRGRVLGARPGREGGEQRDDVVLQVGQGVGGEGAAVGGVEQLRDLGGQARDDPGPLQALGQAADDAAEQLLGGGRVGQRLPHDDDRCRLGRRRDHLGVQLVERTGDHGRLPGADGPRDEDRPARGEAQARPEVVDDVLVAQEGQRRRVAQRPGRGLVVRPQRPPPQLRWRCRVVLGVGPLRYCGPPGVGDQVAVDRRRAGTGARCGAAEPMGPLGKGGKRTGLVRGARRARYRLRGSSRRWTIRLTARGGQQGGGAEDGDVLAGEPSGAPGRSARLGECHPERPGTGEPIGRVGRQTGHDDARRWVRGCRGPRSAGARAPRKRA